MGFALLVCSVLAAAPADKPADDRAAYEAARSKAGRNPHEHIKLALWCEAHGLDGGRLKHLAIAVLLDPKDNVARGLLGLVAYQGKWQRPETIAASARQDESAIAALSEYNARRSRTKYTADEQWKLALWCSENGLNAEAAAHFASVTRLDPAREAAWKRLGYEKHGGRWLTPAQWVDERTEVEAQKKADKYWRPLLTKWRGWLGLKAQRAEAERLLAAVDDPRAVRSVWNVFATAGATHQTVAVQLLGQIDAGAASRGLALLALIGGSGEVRRAAIESLARRDPREYAGPLISMLRDPVRYEVRPVNGPGSVGVLLVEGKKFNVERLYSPPPPFLTVPNLPPDTVLGFDAQGLPFLRSTVVFATREVHVNWREFFRDADSVVARAELADPASAGVGMHNGVPGFQDFMTRIGLGQLNYHQMGISPVTPASIHRDAAQFRAEAQKSLQELHPNPGTQLGVQTTTFATFDTPIGQMMLQAQQAATQTAAIAQEKLRTDVASIEQFNAFVGDDNSRIVRVLNGATGQNLDPDRATWTQWYVDQLGYRYAPPDDTPRPTIVEDVPLPITPVPSPPVNLRLTDQQCLLRISCFGAGTPVLTLHGPRAIETLKVGDRVLSQNTRTGALNYQPVLVVHHNPPGKTLRITLKGESIVSSEFHRFWVAGRGWVMARELKSGDTVRVLGGVAPIESIENDAVQPVFNLDVAEDADFFVGRASALVHDNSLPGLRLAPFDAAPADSVVK